LNAPGIDVNQKGFFEEIARQNRRLARLNELNRIGPIIREPNERSIRN
jgi:hypothetical protein